MPNIMPIYNAAPMAKTEFGKVIGRKMMALTSSDQCGDARSRPALKKASDSAAESCVDDRRPDFCATGFIDMAKSPPHGLAHSLYLANRSGRHLNRALTEIIIAFAVAPALI